MSQCSSTIRPLQTASGSEMELGAQVEGIDLNDLNDEQFATVHRSLYRYHFLVSKNQQRLSLQAQSELTQKLDAATNSFNDQESADTYGFPQIVDRQPQIQAVGKSHATIWIDDRDETGYRFTRFYHWHIDGTFYDEYPPQVTTLLVMNVPKDREPLLLYNDGTRETLGVPLGTIAFASGEQMFELLSAEDQEFAKTSHVEYAPHP